MHRLITTATLMTLFAASAFAQCHTGTPSHVSFDRGKTSAEINGEMPIKGDACYTLRARSGQQMSVSLSSVHDYARFNVFPPGGDHTIARETSEWSGVLPESGDYVIAVYPRANDEAGSFTLHVSITAAATPAAAPTNGAGAQPYTFDGGEGAYVFDGKPPKGLEELTALELPGVLLKLGKDGASVVSVSTEPHAIVYTKGGRQFKAQRVFITGDQITFETVAVRGVSYQFTGRFTKRQVDKDQLLDAGLKGRLTKFVNGSKVAEAPLDLHQEIGG